MLQMPSPSKTKHALNRKPCCIFLPPRTSPCMACGARGGESKRSDGQASTFLLCCILYWRQEYPSFYCTLIYYSETGDKVSRESVSVYVCPQCSLLTPESDRLSNVQLHYWAVRSSTHTELHLYLFEHCIDFSKLLFFPPSMHTFVHAVSCLLPSWPVQVILHLWHWGPPWTSSLVFFCRDGSTWESPLASLEDLSQSTWQINSEWTQCTWHLRAIILRFVRVHQFCALRVSVLVFLMVYIADHIDILTNRE